MVVNTKHSEGDTVVYSENLMDKIMMSGKVSKIVVRSSNNVTVVEYLIGTGANLYAEEHCHALADLEVELEKCYQAQLTELNNRKATVLLDINTLKSTVTV